MYQLYLELYYLCEHTIFELFVLKYILFDIIKFFRAKFTTN